MSHRSLLLTVVLLLVWCCSMTTAEKKAAKDPFLTPTTSENDYESVKEDMTCRICIQVSQLYYTYYLGMFLPSRYADYAEKGAGKGSDGLRERVASDIDEVVESLCDKYHRYLLKQNAKNKETNQTLSDSSIQSLKAICPSVLEVLEETFVTDGTTELFSLLQKDTRKKKNSVIQKEFGSFCEKKKLCIPYLHHHISFGEKMKFKDISITNHHVSPGQFKQTETDRLVAEQKKKSPLYKDSTSRDVHETFEALIEEFNEVHSVFYYLFRWETYKSLFVTGDPKDAALPSARDIIVNNVFKLSFWKLLFKFVVYDDSFWFHFSDTLKYIFVPVAVGSVIVALLLSVVYTFLFGKKEDTSG
ncbi:hypothetical protein ADEAN_000135800 [Angomonas deanei]|uniref:Transmembrane protein n=1 Tax=Angomonas deanei TaxID=59799 RepID=A0A7G2C3R6_9TRYP|nr:hypothetical protein ADEAN_000135800 [Angomonas deanei]